MNSNKKKEILSELLKKCAHLSVETLEIGLIDTYIEFLLKLKALLLNTDEDVIRELSYSENIIRTIVNDRLMMSTSIIKEPDQISLLSTLVTYMECKNEGMQEHSRAYMDRVTKLRHMIDEHYGLKSQQFCGS